jgi:hypothetical protein
MISTHYTTPFTNRIRKKRKIKRSSKLLFIFLEAFNDPFVAAVETASQSSLSTRAKLHKVQAA